MSGKELIDYLIVSGELHVRPISDVETYEDRLTKRLIENLSKYKEDIKEPYKLMLNHYKNEYEVYEILDRLGLLLVVNKISPKGISDLVRNIDFLVGRKAGSKKDLLTRYLYTINDAKRNKEAKVNQFQMVIGNNDYTILFNIENYCKIRLDENRKTNAKFYKNGKLIGTIFGVKYIMFNSSSIDVVTNKDFDENRKYFLDRDKDRLKISFVKSI